MQENISKIEKQKKIYYPVFILVDYYWNNLFAGENTYYPF